ncbi:MAG TPA: (Fe-S)-binding protein, partial [Chroococcales cyanobacterium]
IAAVEVLEDAGFHVIVPAPDMCCGRPLYDYGMLNLAKRWLREALLILKPYIEGGMPIVFLEPSCAAVFKDELPELMPADEDGKRLQKQVYPVSQFIVDRAPDYKIPPLRQKVLLQVHCHHKSVLTRKDHHELFERMQAEVEIPEPGCCGMAGAFGYEAENGHCDVSKKIGEERLLPAVNQLPKNRLVIADGFSCRGQIEQGSDRQAVHTAQAIKLALQDVSAFVPYPEKQVLANDKKIRFTTTEKSLGAIVALLLSFLAVRQFTGSRAHERKSADG